MACEKRSYPRDKLTSSFHGTNMKIHNMCAKIGKKKEHIHSYKRFVLHDKAYEETKKENRGKTIGFCRSICSFAMQFVKVDENLHVIPLAITAVLVGCLRFFYGSPPGGLRGFHRFPRGSLRFFFFIRLSPSSLQMFYRIFTVCGGFHFALQISAGHLTDFLQISA